MLLLIIDRHRQNISGVKRSKNCTGTGLSLVLVMNFCYCTKVVQDPLAVARVWKQEVKKKKKTQHILQMLSQLTAVKKSFHMKPYRNTVFVSVRHTASTAEKQQTSISFQYHGVTMLHI